MAGLGDVPAVVVRMGNWRLEAVSPGHAIIATRVEEGTFTCASFSIKYIDHRRVTIRGTVATCDGATPTVLCAVTVAFEIGAVYAAIAASIPLNVTWVVHKSAPVHRACMTDHDVVEIAARCLAPPASVYGPGPTWQLQSENRTLWIVVTRHTVTVAAATVHRTVAGEWSLADVAGVCVAARCQAPIRRTPTSWPSVLAQRH